jgi:glycosyltransferase involved in cell wall biosynthesis
MKMLRVISSVDPTCGGPINGLINSSRELLKRGHEVDVVSLDDPNKKWVSSFEFPLVSFKSSFGVYSYSLEFSQWLKINVNNYDIVVIHGLWQFHSYAAAKSCKKNDVPFVVFSHGMLDPWFNKTDKLKTIKKKLYWILFERHVINSADSVLFTSEEERSLARTSFSPYSPVERVVAYGSPLQKVNFDLARDTFYKEHSLLKNKRFAVFISRIHKKKGIDLLIDALGKIQKIPDDFMLAIAGPDNTGLKSKLVEQVEKLGLTERVVWLGMLQGDIKWGAYHAAEVFVLPSHQENFGIVVAEALSTATPVLITNKVNIWREIHALGAGFVANDDIQGVGKLLQQWFDLTDSEKLVMNEKAKLCYLKNFSIDSAVSDLESVLTATLKSAVYSHDKNVT